MYDENGKICILAGEFWAARQRCRPDNRSPLDAAVIAYFDSAAVPVSVCTKKAKSFHAYCIEFFELQVIR